MNEPGWYDDGSGASRWWDGAQWTDHVQPGAASPGGTPRSGRTGLIIVAVATVLLLIAGGVLAFLLLRGDSPEDVAEKWASTRSCSEFRSLQTDELNDADDDENVECDLSDYEITDFEVVESSESGDHATVRFTSEYDYTGDDNERDNVSTTDVTAELVREDGEWKVNDVTYEDE